MRFGQGPKTETHRDTVKQGVAFALAIALEDTNILENLRVDFDDIIISNRVFAQEIKYEPTGRLEHNVFIAQRATADGIRLVFALFVTRSEGQTIDKVHGSRALSVCAHFILEVSGIVVSNAINVILQEV